MIPFAGVKILDPGDHVPDPLQQFLEALTRRSFRLAKCFLPAALTTARSKLLAVQVQPTDVERPGIGQCSQHAVWFLNHVRGKFVSMWMEDSKNGIRLPIVAFELVACVTAVNPIFQPMRATL